MIAKHVRLKTINLVPENEVERDLLALFLKVENRAKLRFHSLNCNRLQSISIEIDDGGASP